jgi:hypothetical protein
VGQILERLGFRDHGGPNRRNPQVLDIFLVKQFGEDLRRWI